MPLKKEVRALAFSPDGRALASARMSRVVRLWDPVTGQELLTLAAARGQVNGLAFSPDGTTLLAADHSGAVRIHRGSPDPRDPGPDEPPAPAAGERIPSR
jgi:WD40 repeat protein